MGLSRGTRAFRQAKLAFVALGKAIYCDKLAFRAKCKAYGPKSRYKGL